jgi:hypothetical protein
MNDAPGKIPSIPQTLLGKPFGIEALKAVREEIAWAEGYNRAEIARRVCRCLDWRSAGGRLQLMSARVALLRLHRAGFIDLPDPTCGNGNGRRLEPSATNLPEKCPVSLSVDELAGLWLRPVERPQESSLYNALIEIYHYLGYRPMAGSQVRYLFGWDEGILGAISFGASAWKVAARDRYIGWSPIVRERKLHLVVNNSRFLILPWVHSANLASKILSMSARRLPADFTRLYGYSPVLLETFVETGRFRGHCYRAANWIHVGQTQGRGKKHRYKTPGVAVKDVWLYPLRRDFRHLLARG